MNASVLNAKVWLIVFTTQLLLATGSVKAVPPGFADTVILPNLEDPVSLQSLPDGQMLVLLKTGRILITDPLAEAATAQTFLQLEDVDTYGERGLLDIALDPNFEVNGYFYISYAHSERNRFRISRFTRAGNQASLDTERVIWENPEAINHPYHHGGGLAFGPDGFLYYAQGEQFDGDDAQDLENYRGTIIRIGKDGSIPTDNPFFDGSGPRADAIWSYGIRNPYTIYWDLPTQRLFVNEVGGNSNSKSTEDIHLVAAGDNLGWPFCEGDCSDTSPEFRAPLYFYPHNGSGAAVVGGFVYSPTENATHPFPAEYDGAYFFGDYVDGFIHYLTFTDDPTEVAAAKTFVADGGAGVIVNLKQGYDGSLYYVTLVGPPDFDQGTGQLRRIRYTPDNIAPEIESVTTTPAQVSSAPAAITFNVDALDADGDSLSVLWDFGDGTTATGFSVVHDYLSKGQYEIGVAVSDGKVATEADAGLVIVGISPQVTALQPNAGYQFRAGEYVYFAAEAEDADGQLQDEDFEWSIRFFHNEHTHPLVEKVIGRSGSFQVPTDGHSFLSDTGFEFLLKVTDADGIETLISRKIWPEEIDLTVSSDLTEAAAIKLDGVPISEPTTFDTAIGFVHTLTTQADACIDDRHFVFEQWSTGATERETRFEVPATNSALVAEYRQDGLACDSYCGTALSIAEGQWVNLPDIVLEGDFTLETWVNFNGAIDANDSLLGQIGRGLDINFHRGRMRLYVPSYWWYPNRVIGETELQAGIWHHLALVRSGSELMLYLNGRPDGTGQYSGEVPIAALGRGHRGVSFNGKLDELRIWDVARDAATISANYLRSVPTDAEGLIAYWKFNEASETIRLRDSVDVSRMALLGSSIARGPDAPDFIKSDNLAFSELCLERGRAPTALDDSAAVAVLTAVEINVLANDFDGAAPLDPDSLEIIDAPSQGQLELLGGGRVRYRHSGDTGDDQFSYRVFDNKGVESNPATVSLVIEDANSGWDFWSLW